jgi:hypothetical protein
MATTRLHLDHIPARPQAGVLRLALRWLLVFVLALDLVGAPLHEHRHDGDLPAGGVAHAAAHSHSLDEAPYSIEHDESLQFSHSSTALPSAGKQATDKAAPELVAVLWPAPVVQDRSVRAAFAPREPDTGPRRPVYRSLPPDGRAPPAIC